MPQLTVQNQTFLYPEPGTEAGWGSDATGWAEAVTNALGILLAQGQILPTFLQVLNNVTSPTNLVGLSFNRNQVRAANVFYQVSRKSNTTSEIVESGTMLLNAELTSVVSPVWTMQIQRNGNAGINFSLADSGQISYTTTDIGNAGYVGSIKFSATVLNTP